MSSIGRLKNTVELLSYDEAILEACIGLSKLINKTKTNVIVVCTQSVYDEIYQHLIKEVELYGKLVHVPLGRSGHRLINIFRGATFDGLISVIPDKDYRWGIGATWGVSKATCTSTHAIVYSSKSA